MRSLGEAPDARSGAGEFLFDLLVAPVNMVDAVDHRLPGSAQSRQQQTGTGPEIGGDHSGAGQRPAGDDGAPAFDADLGSHAR